MAKVNVNLERKCKCSFIETYQDFAKHLECPPDFSLWAAVSMVGIALGRNCYATKGFMKLYPNLYVILVGPSAVGKGVALTNGLTVLREGLGETLCLFSQKASPESFIQFLSEGAEESGKSQALIFAPEFSTFIGKSRLDPSMIQILTDYYDSPEFRSYTTRGRGKEEMKNLCINMQAGSTPDWIKNSLPEDAIGGGFTSRLILINRREGGPKNPFPVIDGYTSVCRDRCIHDIKMIAQLRGEYQWTDSAKDLYTDWYMEYEQIQRAKGGPNLEGYYGRKGTLVIKLGMILSAASGDSMQISEQNIMGSLALLGDNEEHLHYLMKSMAQSESGRMIDRVRSLIRKRGMITKGELLRKVSHQLTAAELEPILDTLIDGEEVEGTRDGKKRIYIWVTEEILRRKEAAHKRQMANELRIIDGDK